MYAKSNPRKNVEYLVGCIDRATTTSALKNAISKARSAADQGLIDRKARDRVERAAREKMAEIEGSRQETAQP